MSKQDEPKECADCAEPFNLHLPRYGDSSGDAVCWRCLNMRNDARELAAELREERKAEGP